MTPPPPSTPCTSLCTCCPTNAPPPPTHTHKMEHTILPGGRRDGMIYRNNYDHRPEEFEDWEFVRPVIGRRLSQEKIRRPSGEGSLWNESVSTLRLVPFPLSPVNPQATLCIFLSDLLYPYECELFNAFF